VIHDIDSRETLRWEFAAEIMNKWTESVMLAKPLELPRFQFDVI
jgi:hypothetical protein